MRNRLFRLSGLEWVKSKSSLSFVWIKRRPTNPKHSQHTPAWTSVFHSIHCVLQLRRLSFDPFSFCRRAFFGHLSPHLFSSSSYTIFTHLGCLFSAFFFFRGKKLVSLSLDPTLASPLIFTIGRSSFCSFVWRQWVIFVQFYSRLVLRKRLRPCRKIKTVCSTDFQLDFVQFLRFFVRLVCVRSPPSSSCSSSSSSRPAPLPSFSVSAAKVAIVAKRTYIRPTNRTIQGFGAECVCFSILSARIISYHHQDYDDDGRSGATGLNLAPFENTCASSPPFAFFLTYSSFLSLPLFLFFVLKRFSIDFRLDCLFLSVLPFDLHSDRFFHCCRRVAPFGFCCSTFSSSSPIRMFIWLNQQRHHFLVCHTQFGHFFCFNRFDLLSCVRVRLIYISLVTVLNFLFPFNFSSFAFGFDLLWLITLSIALLFDWQSQKMHPIVFSITWTKSSFVHLIVVLVLLLCFFDLSPHSADDFGLFLSVRLPYVCNCFTFFLPTRPAPLSHTHPDN